MTHTPPLQIVCTSASHGTKVVRIDLVWRDDGGSWYAGAGKGASARLETMFVINEENELTAAGQPVARDANGHVVMKSDERRRFNLECPLCGLRVVARGERLDLILDTFLEWAVETAGESGVPSLPLALLAAKVSR